ncbi:MAG: hypothetical protein QW797_03580 [Thermoproteota archaeon]
MASEQPLPVSKYVIRVEFEVEGVVERIFLKIEDSRRNMTL